MKKNLLIVLVLAFAFNTTKAQYTTLNAHSHNDYEQKTPFYLAYHAQFGSIEADIWAVDGELFVAHNKTEITAANTLDHLYIEPIVALFKKFGGRVSADPSYAFQLLIDLKTSVEPTLTLLTEKLKKYPDVFDPAVNKYAVRITITGNRPDPSGFKAYPNFIFFDGNIKKKYNADQLKRIGIYSENLAVFTSWKGKEAIPVQEKIRLKQIVDSVHGIHKRIRFWNAPDTPEAWEVLMNLKVDLINTDHIPELSAFLKN